MPSASAPGSKWKDRAERDRLARGRANCYREAAIHYKRALECQLAIAAKTPYPPATRAKLLAGDRVRGFSLPGGFPDWQGELANHLYWGQRIYDESDVWDLRVSAIEGSTVIVGYLIQLSILLRAAVAISSERQRGTWDSLLTSPLQAREIVVGKLCGSLYALRWLILAAIWAWTLVVIFGPMTLKHYIFHLLGIVVIGACMAAIGVRVSLATEAGTRSMSLAVGLWLGVLALLSVVAVILIFIGFMAIQVFWWSFHRFAIQPGAGTPFVVVPMSFEDAWQTVMLFLYLVLAVVVVIESRYRFDRIAGRMTGGAVEIAVDQFLHGVPMDPVRLDPISAPEQAALPRLEKRVM